MSPSHCATLSAVGCQAPLALWQFAVKILPFIFSRGSFHPPTAAHANQARVVAETVEQKLLDVGGLATTLIESGQQWDAPNGWAPLQWIAVIGLRNYGFDGLAHEIAARWVHENIAGYRRYAKLVEKYNVATPGGEEGGGGEYATQIGFGWTNGVLVALTSLYPDLKAEAAKAVPE
jgi:alpha,alpha-trehalase